MSPIELLKHGLENGSWAYIAEAYRGLTGAVINPPNSPECNKATEVLVEIQALIAEYFGEKPPERIIKPLADVVQNLVDNAPAEQLAQRRVTVSAGEASKPRKPNRFVDDLSLEVDKIEESKALAEKAKKKAYREKYQEVNVVCSRCNKSESVHPTLVPRPVDAHDDAPAYVCNRCLGGRRS